jgi:hypothetical protein
VQYPEYVGQAESSPRVPRKTKSKIQSGVGGPAWKTTSAATIRGALKSFHDRAVRLFCFECRTVQSVKKVTALQNMPSGIATMNTLGCGHSRALFEQIKRSEKESHELGESTVSLQFVEAQERREADPEEEN